jgi:DNA-directed RNA polymerase specialized sigma24 family protein
MSTYRAQVSRDGKYWLVYVPDIDKYTQARNLAEVESQARDLISLWLEVPSNTVDIHQVIELPVDVHDHLELAQRFRDEASRAQAEAAREYRSAATALKAQGMTLRDIGQALGVSHQRAQQLIDSHRASG